MTEFCEVFPNCQAAQVAAEQTRNNKELNKKLDAIADHQKSFGESIMEIGFKLMDVKHLSAKLDELKENNEKEHNKLFALVRELDKTKAEDDEVKKIQQGNLDYKTKLLFILLGVILGGIVPVTIFVLGKAHWQ